MKYIKHFEYRNKPEIDEKTIRVENLDSIQEYIDSLVMEIKKLI